MIVYVYGGLLCHRVPQIIHVEHLHVLKPMVWDNPWPRKPPQKKKMNRTVIYFSTFWWEFFFDLFGRCYGYDKYDICRFRDT